MWHLQYTDWPDHGCPDDTYGFLGLVYTFLHLNKIIMVKISITNIFDDSILQTVICGKDFL